MVDVIVTALGEDDSFLNFLEVGGSVLDPELQPLMLEMEQTAPGRYEGSFPIDRAGTYFVNVIPGDGNAPLSAGVTVPYSEEFRYRETNETLIAQLASLKPDGGEAGVVTEPLEATLDDALLSRDTFRGGLPLARRIRDAWPWFVLAACVLFFTDVLVRRVAIRFGFLKTWWKRMVGDAQPEATTVARLDQLRQTKEDVNKQRRASPRFEPESIDIGGSKESGVDGLDSSQRRSGDSQDASRPASSPSSQEESSATSYTERLLEAKRRAKKK
jgi:hypothetical protein